MGWSQVRNKRRGTKTSARGVKYWAYRKLPVAVRHKQWASIRMANGHDEWFWGNKQTLGSSTTEAVFSPSYRARNVSS